MVFRRRILSVIVSVLAASVLPAQTFYEYSSPTARLVFFDKNLSNYIPHMIRMYENGKALQNQVWQTDPEHPYDFGQIMFMVTDWEDDGNGGASALPKNMIQFGMAPLNFSYFIAPSTERYNHLFRHELTHTVMTDKSAAPDRFWRTALGGKFTVDATHPFSALWSYLAAPRWYAPRWYHEGIACFMETWTGGGVGRALGCYDEMYFRSIVDAGETLCSVVGLEMEGTTSDFQLGTNSYLYGTRFDNYLEYKYGFDKLRDFYNRTEDSKTLFNKQFKKVYGQSLKTVWNDWRDFEYQHQKEQMDLIAEYPLTELDRLTDKAMGSAAPPVYDPENGCFYTAVTYPGDFAHIERIDLNTRERRKIHIIDGPMLYSTTYLTLDQKGQRLMWTTQNGKMRGLRVYDLNTRRIVKELNFQRVSSIAYNNVDDHLYGIFSNAGVSWLCRYDSQLEDRQLLYSFPFGESVFDLAVSNDGKWVTVTTSGNNGEQSLLRFLISDLENANFRSEIVCTFEDSNLGQFRFAPDDRSLVGSSYYNGVSNVWRINLPEEGKPCSPDDPDIEMLSNVKIGLFSPVVISEDSILALEFERNGFRPVLFKPEVQTDANAVSMLGQVAYEAHPEELEALSELKTPLPQISFGEVFDSIHEYSLWKNISFTGAYPEVSGFRDKEAWNGVTPVLGYRLLFQDPLGMNAIKLTLGISPWSSNDPINQYHAQIDWKYMLWTFKAAWNPTNFYDLVGPIRYSRKGWQVTAAYDRSYSLLSPASHSWGFNVGAYGMMDALPLHQEVAVDDAVSSFQTASAYFEYSKTRSSLGSVMAERGIVAGVDASTYLVSGKFYPTLNASLDLGFPVPFVRNTCVWLRGNLGQNFGDSQTVFGNEYFGGFGNNWLDWREANRYRNVCSMPGAEIDAITAHSYGKVTAELSLKPIRYKNFGLLNLYPTYTQLNLYSSYLSADPWGNVRATQNYIDIGAQLNTETVLLKYLKTSFSVGYARLRRPDGGWQGDWLLSIKLL